MATKFGTLRERKRNQERLSGMRRTEADPYEFGSIKDKGSFYKNKKKLESIQETLDPVPVNGDADRKKLEARQKQLEEFIKRPCAEIKKPEMPSNHEMELTPAGAVGKHRRFEYFIKNFNLTPDGKVVRNREYSARDEWRDNQLRLSSDDEQEFDQEISSLERLRPQNPGGKALADYASLSYAQGAAVTEEQWEGTVGKRIPSRKCSRRHLNGKRCRREAVGDSEYCAPCNKRVTAIARKAAAVPAPESQAATA